eukprot:m.197757 g.197757  ORF g.197757 m.197757 type:complete len:64 (-) comp15711_c0_seq42:161-352(-)
MPIDFGKEFSHISHFCPEFGSLLLSDFKILKLTLAAWSLILGLLGLRWKEYLRLHNSFKHGQK